MGENEFWLVILILVAIGYFVFRIQEYQKEKTIVTQERANLISKPIPNFVQKSIFDYQSGTYGGEEALTYSEMPAAMPIQHPMR